MPCQIGILPKNLNKTIITLTWFGVFFLCVYFCHHVCHLLCCSAQLWDILCAIICLWKRVEFNLINILEIPISKVFLISFVSRKIWVRILFNATKNWHSNHGIKLSKPNLFQFFLSSTACLLEGFGGWWDIAHFVGLDLFFKNKYN